MKLYLAILSTLMITACSSGGGSGNSSNMTHNSPSETNKSASIITNSMESNQPEPEQKPEKEQQIKTNENNQVENNKVPKPVNKPQISVPAPQPIANPYTDDNTVFNKLTKMPSDLNGNHFLSIELSGQHIQLVPSKDNVTINSNHIHTLRDNKGNLFGYYGDATLSESVVDIYNPSEKKAKHSYAALLDYDRNNTPIQPTQNIRYDGSMYYNYINIPAQSLKATVVGIYKSDNKRLAMEIYNQQDMDLELREDHNKRDVAVLANLDNEHFDNISGKLYNKDNQFVGEFNGGIYGNMGEILIGKTKSREEQGERAWKGIVGATGKTVKDN